MIEVHNPNNDLFSVLMTVVKYYVKGNLVNSESLVNVLIYDAFVRMNLLLNCLESISIPLVAFNRELVDVEGEITFAVIARTSSRLKMVFATFTVVQVSSVYNAILGCPRLNQLNAAISTKHLLVCFLTGNGVGEMRGD